MFNSRYNFLKLGVFNSRSNFLKLDIYYSEVKYEMVKQKQSYGPLEFFCKSNKNLTIFQHT